MGRRSPHLLERGRVRHQDDGAAGVVHAAQGDRSGHCPGQRAAAGVADDQQIGVVGGLAQRCVGWPVETVKPLLRRAWREAFRSELSDASLSACAEGICDGRPWEDILWPSC